MRAVDGKAIMALMLAAGREIVPLPVAEQASLTAYDQLREAFVGETRRVVRLAEVEQMAKALDIAERTVRAVRERLEDEGAGTRITSGWFVNLTAVPPVTIAEALSISRPGCVLSLESVLDADPKRMTLVQPRSEGSDLRSVSGTILGAPVIIRIAGREQVNPEGIDERLLYANLAGLRVATREKAFCDALMFSQMARGTSLDDLARWSGTINMPMAREISSAMGLAEAFDRSPWTKAVGRKLQRPSA